MYGDWLCDFYTKMMDYIEALIKPNQKNIFIERQQTNILIQESKPFLVLFYIFLSF